MASASTLHDTTHANYLFTAASTTSARYLAIFDDIATDIFVDTALGFSTHKMLLRRDKRFAFDRNQVCLLFFDA